MIPTDVALHAETERILERAGEIAEEQYGLVAAHAIHVFIALLESEDEELLDVIDRASVQKREELLILAHDYALLLAPNEVSGDFADDFRQLFHNVPKLLDFFDGDVRIEPDHLLFAFVHWGEDIGLGDFIVTTQLRSQTIVWRMKENRGFTGVGSADSHPTIRAQRIAARAATNLSDENLEEWLKPESE